MSNIHRGVVKWFNNAKGFGFIEHETGKDVFVHYSVIQSEGFKTLKDGEEVDYELGEGDKGLNAIKVYRVAKSVDSRNLVPVSSQIEVEVEPSGTENQQIPLVARRAQEKSQLTE